jgi:hypothetical protein
MTNLKTVTPTQLVDAYDTLNPGEHRDANGNRNQADLERIFGNWLETYERDPDKALCVVKTAWGGKVTTALFRALEIKQPRTKAAMIAALTITTSIPDHMFAAVLAFGPECKHCDEPRANHPNRPDAFQEADEMANGIRRFLNEIAQVIHRSGDAEDHQALDTLYKLLDSATGEPLLCGTDRARLQQLIERDDIDSKDTELLERVLALTSTPSTPQTPNAHDGRTLWERDEIQFPRLLAEIHASGAFGFQTANETNWDDLCDSMDLTSDEILELFNRAEREWAIIKRNVLSNPPVISTTQNEARNLSI